MFLSLPREVGDRVSDSDKFRTLGGAISLDYLMSLAAEQPQNRKKVKNGLFVKGVNCFVEYISKYCDNSRFSPQEIILKFFCFELVSF